MDIFVSVSVLLQIIKFTSNDRIMKFNGFNKRIKKLQRILNKKGSLPYLISDLKNIRYLTGFAGSFAFMVIGEKKSFFMSDSRYSEYAEKLLPRFVEFLLVKGDFNKTLKSLMNDISCKALYIEEHSLPLSAFLKIKKELRGTKIIPAGDDVNNIRMIKDDSEIAILREAAEITDKCFNHLLGFIKPGISEWDVAIEIENYYKKMGCRKCSFESIVASGKGSSMPHYETSMDKKIESGDVLLIDMGCEYMGYNSDLTRTIFINTIDPELKEIYNIVKSAQESALKYAKPGIISGRLDSRARDLIAAKGYGPMFGHSLGHGLGIEVHEVPALKKGGNLRLKKNMVITIEPGIYSPGLGGVRIEDMVLITAGGNEILTKSPKDIIVI